MSYRLFVLLLAMGFLFSTARASTPGTPSALPGPSSARLAQAGDYVVVVHGLAWLRDTLKPTVRHLQSEGYQVVRFKYNSHKPLDEATLVKEMGTFLKTTCPDPHRRIHFVAHSMGTVVTRLYLAAQPLPNLGQVVLLAPPNQGTELADNVAKSKLLQEIFGHGAPALGTAPDSLPNRLAHPTYTPGVIMGDRSMFWITSWMLPGPDDGVIRVERGKLPGMGGFLVLPANHINLPGNATALREMDSYLRTGAFLRPSPAVY
jgi:triacylglycerol lipase